MSIKSAAYNLVETETRDVARQCLGSDLRRLGTYASFDAAYDALEKVREFGARADGALSLPVRSSARQSDRRPN
jgi:hypothetical protein